MKKLSYWGYRHPRFAKLLLVFIKIAMLLLAWYVADLSRQLGFSFSVDSFYILIGLMLLGILLYPDSRKKKVYFEYSYYIKQKLCDAVITFSSFSIVVIAFNTNLFMQPAYGVIPVQEYEYMANHSDDDSGKVSNRQKRLTQKLAKQIKHFSSSSNKHKKKHAALVLEMVAAILLTVFLGIAVAALSCSLVCSGEGAAALLVFIFGVSGIIAGSITWIKSIRKRKAKLKVEVQKGAYQSE